MNAKLTIGLTGLALTVAVAGAVAGSAAGSGRASVAPVDAVAYVRTIRQPYLRFSAAFHVAVGPCYKKPNLPRCESANLASTAAATTFAKVLARTTPPSQSPEGSPALRSRHETVPRGEQKPAESAAVDSHVDGRGLLPGGRRRERRVGRTERSRSDRPLSPLLARRADPFR